MKRFLLTTVSVVLTAAVVAVSLMGATPRTVHMAALTAIKEGDFAMARSHLLRSDHKDAETLLSYMHYVPDKIVRVTEDGTETENYAYNYAGRLVKHESTDRFGVMTTHNYTYNDLGDPLVSLKTGGAGPDTTTEYFYDQYGHLERKRFMDSEGRFHQYRYVYDALGRVTIEAFVDGDSNWSRRVYSYDGEKALLTEQYTDHAGSWENITYRYKDEVRVREILENEDGLWITTYTDDGKFLSCRLTTEEGVEETRYTYDKQGNLLEERYPDGRLITYTYYEEGLCALMTICEADGTKSEHRLEYNEDGQMTSHEETWTDGTKRTITYTYNKKGLMTAAKFETPDEDWWNATYKYDKNNNPETVTIEDKDGTTTLKLEWTVRYYPDGMPQAIKDLCEEYDVDLPELCHSPEMK